MSRLDKNKEYLSDWTVDKVREEVDSGLDLLNKIDKKIITFFGAHLMKTEDENYEHCQKVSFALGRKGYAIMSGGGPGIMHAANKGATEAKTRSIGLKAGLIKGEEVTDKIFTDELSFDFVFVRRFIMSIKSEALIFYPGGIGTLNELFEYLVLMQTEIVDKVPIICVKKSFWKGLLDWLEKNPLNNKFITEEDLKLIHFADDVDEIIKIIEK